MTPFNMNDEFEDANIDEHGFLNFSRQKTQKKLSKEDHFYGVFNEEI